MAVNTCVKGHQPDLALTLPFNVKNRKKFLRLKSYVKNILAFFLAIVLSLWFMTRIIISIPFNIWKFTVIFAAKILRPELRKIVPTNIYFEKFEKFIQGYNITFSMRVNGILDFEKYKSSALQQIFARRDEENGELIYPEFQNEITTWLGYPFWKMDPSFDINRYILQQSSSDSPFKVEQRVLRHVFKMNDGSPWKCYVVPDTVTQTTTLIFLFHHCLADGYSIYNALAKINQNMNKNVIINPPPRKSGHGSVAKMLFRHIPFIIPRKLIYDFLTCYPIPHPFRNNIGRLNSNRHIVMSSLLSKPFVTGISKKYDVPFTAILLYGLTGAIRDLILKFGNEEIPEFMFCPLAIPIPKKRQGLVNNVQTAGILLPIGSSNPTERLKLCKESYSKAPNSELLLLSKLNPWIDNAYPLFLKNTHIATCPLLLSSFPGPKNYFRIYGQVENDSMSTDMHFTFNGQGIFPLVITTLTYVDGLRITLSADSNILHTEMEATNFLKCFENELTILDTLGCSFNTKISL